MTTLIWCIKYLNLGYNGPLPCSLDSTLIGPWLQASCSCTRSSSREGDTRPPGRFSGGSAMTTIWSSLRSICFPCECSSAAQNEEKRNYSKLWKHIVVYSLLALYLPSSSQTQAVSAAALMFTPLWPFFCCYFNSFYLSVQDKDPPWLHHWAQPQRLPVSSEHLWQARQSEWNG